MTVPHRRLENLMGQHLFKEKKTENMNIKSEVRVEGKDKGITWQVFGRTRSYCN